MYTLYVAYVMHGIVGTLLAHLDTTMQGVRVVFVLSNQYWQYNTTQLIHLRNVPWLSFPRSRAPRDNVAAWIHGPNVTLPKKTIHIANVKVNLVLPSIETIQQQHLWHSLVKACMQSTWQLNAPWPGHGQWWSDYWQRVRAGFIMLSIHCYYPWHLLESVKTHHCLRCVKSGCAVVALIKASLLPFSDKIRWNASSRVLVSTVTSWSRRKEPLTQSSFDKTAQAGKSKNLLLPTAFGTLVTKALSLELKCALSSLHTRTGCTYAFTAGKGDIQWRILYYV